MLEIYTPVKFLHERKYIIEVIFNWILRIPYTCKIHDKTNYLIKLPNGNQIFLSDKLFDALPDNGNFIDSIKAPDKIFYLESQFNPNTSIPLLFGKALVREKELHVPREVEVHGDIFGSALYLVACVDECLNHERDKHGRFEAKNSTAFKYGFLHRPVVNEYAEMIWRILLSLGFNANLRKPIGYKIYPTHDIDKIYYTRNLKNLFGDVFIDKNIMRAFKRIKLPKKNYWDTFSWLMDQSEKNNLISIFYFMADSPHNLDNRYSLKDPFVIEKIKEIMNRGHVIGLHPGYDSIDNLEKWRNQKRLLEGVLNKRILESRQHYLRFNNPETLNILEEAGIQIDSTISYPDMIGFKCGTSCEFPLFNFAKRKISNVIERPLIIMETILRNRKRSEDSAAEAVSIIESYKDTCKNFDIPLTILFHNNSFDPIRWDRWAEVYENHILV